MAYSKKYMIDKCLKAIRDHKIIFFTEIQAFVPFSEATLYNHKLEELEVIKKSIEENRIKLKKGLQKKWYENDNPTTQAMLYKLLASPEELDRLQMQKIDHTSKGESIVGKFIEPPEGYNDKSTD